MPKDYYRIELRLPQETLARLKKLLKESREKTNSKVTINALLSNIVDSYLSELQASELEEK